MSKVSERLVEYMAQRFLNWSLPKDFRPDCGISFTAEYNKNTPYPATHKPTGTNLFDADQAEAMVRYMVDGFSYVATPEKPPVQVFAFTPTSPNEGYVGFLQAFTLTNGNIEVRVRNSEGLVNAIEIPTYMAAQLALALGASKVT